MVQIHRKFLFASIFIILLGNNSFGQELEGEYTIGGIAPDYITISDAIDDLIEFGVSGPVIFNIRANEYSEQLVIPEIEGASELNSIIFQSEDERRDSVIIKFNPIGAADNYVANLVGADFIEFRHLTIANYQIDYATCVQLIDTTESIVFHNVLLDGYGNGTSEANHSTVRLHTTCVSTDLKFDNCEFERSPVLILGNSTAPISGFILENSLLKIGKVIGIKLFKTSNCTIKNNRFVNVTDEIDAIVLQNAAGWVDISDNTMDLNDGTALKITGVAVDGLDSLYLVNNYFTSESGISDYAFHLKGINDGFVANNTFNFNICWGYRFENCHDFAMFNNIFNVKDLGSVDFVGCTGFNSDYNCYNGKYFKLEGITIYDFEEFRSALGTDLNSFYHSALIAGTPLAYTTNDFFLNQTGLELIEVSDDIGGESRESPPDIGADEFNITPLELGITNVSLGGEYLCHGLNPVKLSFVSLGSNAVTEILFRIMVNGELHSTAIWSGDLPGGESLIDETIAWIELDAGTEIDIQVEAIQVNGGVDTYAFNNIYNLNDIKVNLSGNYYIGGVFPDYENVTTAVADLNEFGTCGNVNFIIRKGTYTGSNHLNNYYTSSDHDTVIFRGETENRNLYNINSSTAYTFMVTSSKNIIFQDLNFSKSGSAHKIFIINGSDNILIDRCAMQTMVGNDMSGPDINSLLGSQAVITLFFDDRIKISNCEIEDGAASIYANGSTNCLFENNLLKDFTICGINCKDSDSIDINQNVLRTALPYGYNEQLYGIRFQNSNDRIHVSNNYLKIEHGIALGAINCDFSENEIWNNAITNSIANTVSFQNVENTYLKFNSIHLMLDEDEDEPYDLMDFSDVTNFNCENTIFQNSTSGDFLTMDPLGAFFDYNDIFLNGGLFSPSYPSFEAWQLAGYGPNSFNVDPLFFTDENLRIQENPTLFGQGNGVYPIVKDLESKSREIPPSLGAYRFGVDTIDLELIEVVAPVSCDSLLGLIVNFTNHGPDTLLGAYLFFDINDEVDSFYWTGNLPAGDTIFNLHLSPFIFDGDLAYDISVWTANENWHFDGITSNDTASTTISGSHLKGSFTIGEYYADFLNIQEAVIALKTSGMCGDVTLNFQNGLFPETVIFTDIPGLDTTHLTIQSISETGDSVVVTGRWIFNKIENITVQNMTFAESNPLESWSSFELEDTCANISFLGNKFGYLGITGYGAIVFRASGDFTDINIIGNQILYCTGLFISGNSLGDKTNIVIKDNDLGNRSQGGISLKYCDGLIFENNFNRLISGSNILATFDEISGMVEIKNNDLGRKGLRINNSDGTEVDPILIYNNIIGSVHFSNVSYIKFNHNTVANMLTTGCLTGILILESGVTDFESYNNIFFLKSCDRFLDFKSALMLEEAANIYWDYNVYYANPVLPYHDDKIGHVLFANPSGSDWNMAQWLENTDYDDNSVWGDPQFISEINLHLNQDNVSPFLSDTLPVEVVDDIDNEVRDLTEPTIGADEFTPHSSNARLVGFDVPTICDSTKHIWALLVNTGTELLTSATLEWEIDGVALPSVIWTGALATLDTVDVYLGDYVVTTGHKIVRAWPTLPNGLTDPFTLFDTSQTELSIKFNGHYTVYGESADFPSLQIAIDSLTRYGICDSVYLDVRSGIYGDNIDIGYIKGGSDSSWVVIQSETLDSNDVVYNGPGYTDDYAFEFDSAHYVQLRHITVDRYSPGSFGNISSIGIVNRSSYVSICNNRLKSAYGTGPWNGVIHVGNAAVDGRDTEIHHINILNNQFETEEACCIWISGAGNEETENVTIESFRIKNNVFIPHTEIEFFDSDEPIIAFSKVKNLEISNNLMKSDRGRAIIGGGYTDTLLIANNSIYNNQTWETFYISQSLPAEAIDAEQFIKIINNEFAEYGNSGRSIVLYGSDGGLIGNNSFHTNSTVTTAYILYLSSATNDIKIINNQFIAEDEGYCFFSEDSNYFDYNNYFCSGDIGFHDGFSIENIEDSQDLMGLDSNSIFGNPVFLNDSTLLSTNLINVDKGENLESVVGDILGNERGLRYDIGAYEIDDFEYNLTLLEIIAEANFCHDSLLIYITFKNNGLLTINNFDIEIGGSGVEPSSDSWAGVLNPLDVDSNYFVLTTSIVDLPAEYTVTIANPNGETDGYDGDNTLTNTFSYVFPTHPVLLEICNGDSILIGDSFESEEGYYFDTLTSIHGCDSIVQYEIETRDLILTSIELGVCEGDSILIAGEYQFLEGVYYDTLVSIHGCDSVISNHLEFIEYTAIIDDIDDSFICIGGEVIELHGLPLGGVFSGVGVTGSEFDPTLSGIGIFNIYYTYTEGSCLTVDSAVIQVVDCLTISALNNEKITIHPNPTNGKLTLDFGGGLDSDYLLFVRNSAGDIIIQNENVAGTNFTLDLSPFERGMYMLILYDKTLKKEVYIEKIILE